MRLLFEVHYADGTILQGTTLKDWQAMPDEGVLVVVEVYDRTYKGKYTCRRHAGRDYYWMLDNGEIGAHAAKYIPANAHIKRGQQVDDATWMRIYNRACIDPKVN